MTRDEDLAESELFVETDHVLCIQIRSNTQSSFVL